LLTYNRLVSIISAVAAFLLAHQFIWVFTISTALYIVILLGYQTPLLWIGIAAVYLSFLLRLKLHGHVSRRTIFDLPIAIFLVGALVGLIVSPDRTLSLGAFQGLLLLIAVYYSILNHPNPAALVKFLLSFSIVLLVLTTVFYFLRDKQPVRLSSLPFPIFKSSEGLAHFLLIIGSFFVGLGLFTKRKALKIFMVLSVCTLIALAFFATYYSWGYLFSGWSMTVRLPIWRDAIDMLQGKWFTGIGLGYFPVQYNVGEIVYESTQIHNAYLELYASTGVIGAIAGLMAAVVVIKTCYRVLRSPRYSWWYGLGVGVCLSILVTALYSLLASAPIMIVGVGWDAYHPVISFAPFLFALSLEIVYRQLRQDPLKQKLTL
jgi:hypothetical protein